jgi:hypothetical protein
MNEKEYENWLPDGFAEWGDIEQYEFILANNKFIEYESHTQGADHMFVFPWVLVDNVKYGHLTLFYTSLSRGAVELLEKYKDEGYFVYANSLENQTVKIPHFHICKKLPKTVVEVYS